MGLAKLVSISKIVFYFMLFVGCSQVTCRGDVDKPKQSGTISPEKSSSVAPNPAEAPVNARVTVYKADGSLQCGMGEAVALTVMKKELGSIKVFNSYKRSDGMMRIQLCGSPTGNCNFYEIDQKDLTAALAAGFLEWKK